MRLVQLLGDEVEELYQVKHLTNDEIYRMYQEYQESDFEDFEEFIQHEYEDEYVERVFVDEIYV